MEVVEVDGGESDEHQRSAATHRQAEDHLRPARVPCAFEARAEDANAPPGNGSEQVTVENLVELQMAETLSIAEVALLEARIPGICAAVSEWLHDID
jgi:hypothetical protein